MTTQESQMSLDLPDAPPTEPQPSMPFRLNMTATQARRAQQLLRAHGVDFNPARDMCVSNESDNTQDEAWASESENIANELNEHLEYHELQPMLPTRKLNLEELHQLLTMATQEFLWKSGSNTVLERQRGGETWPETLARYPLLEARAKDTRSRMLRE